MASVFETEYTNDDLIPAVRAQGPARFALYPQEPGRNPISVIAIEPSRERRWSQQRLVEINTAILTRKAHPAHTKPRVHRQEDELLAIDIPARGWTLSGTLGMVCLVVAWFGGLAIPGYFFLRNTLTGDLLWLLPLLPVVLFWVLGMAAVYTSVKELFTRKKLVITQTDFRIEQRLQFRRWKTDPDSSVDSPEEELNRRDRLLCQQIAGSTRDLDRAEVRAVEGTDGERVLVLWQGDTKHYLDLLTDNAEKYRLAELINSFLQVLRPLRRESAINNDCLPV